MPLGRSRQRWKDNIKMDVQGIGYKGVDWIKLAQDSVHWRVTVDMVMNVPIPKWLKLSDQRLS
jgi:hypothetical protein